MELINCETFRAKISPETCRIRKEKAAKAAKADPHDLVNGAILSFRRCLDCKPEGMRKTKVEVDMGEGKRKYAMSEAALKGRGGNRGNPSGELLSGVQQGIAEECDRIKEMLLDKNRKYGNSALNPVRVFSSAAPLEQINVRIDDKLSRLKSAQADEDEDVVQDLIGYLILRTVAKKIQRG